MQEALVPSAPGFHSLGMLDAPERLQVARNSAASGQETPPTIRWLWESKKATGLYKLPSPRFQQPEVRSLLFLSAHPT